MGGQRVVAEKPGRVRRQGGFVERVGVESQQVVVRMDVVEADPSAVAQHLCHEWIVGEWSGRGIGGLRRLWIECGVGWW